MMYSDNGDGVGVESYASPSGHGIDMPMAWQSETPASLRAAAAAAATRGGHFLPPPTAGFEYCSADSGVVEWSGGSSGSKKRRKSEEVDGMDQERTSNASADSAGGTKRSKDANGGTAATTGESKGKGASEGGEPRKESYAHVRARSGQSTNSHSLAEKVRREKISERMKLLQDLVPGCSKVTGKAVMLDEIINYVQSLQRQVEFLSMKLSTVNPRLDCNIESLISEHIIPFHWSPSTAPIGFTFSQEMMLKPSQSGMLQGGVHGMANPDVFGQPASQIHHTLDGSTFHDTAQMVWPDQDGFHHM